MSEFYSKVAGVNAKNSIGDKRQYLIGAYCKPNMELKLIREPDNKYGSNAIGVWIEATALFFFKSIVQIGHLNAEIAKEISDYLDNGVQVSAKVKEVTGGKDNGNYGVNILISID